MLDLFNQDPFQNLLPYQGEVHYFGKIFNQIMANTFFQELLATIPWQNDEAYVFGKHIITKRKVAWFGDQAYHYTYSNATKTALPWTSELKTILKQVESVTKQSFNSCLINLYHNGDEGMTWHSDGEKALVKDGCIASVSFGAQRKFSFKHKSTKEKVDLFLENGSLLTMTGETQTYWLHRLPPTKKVKTPRINLTFRQYQV